MSFEELCELVNEVQQSAKQEKGRAQSPSFLITSNAIQLKLFLSAHRSLS